MLDTLFMAIGYGLCHQLPERSFFAGGFQLPVCARDTGIYLGFAVGLLAVTLIHRAERPTGPPPWPVLVLVAAFIAAMGYDGVTSYLGLRESTNDLRLATGMLTGWALSGITFPMINAQLWQRSSSGHLLSTPGRVVSWLLLLVGTFTLARWVMPLTGAFYPIAVSASILLTFTTVNLIFVCLVPAFERRAGRIRDAWPQVLIALALTAMELAAAAWLRALTGRLLS
jgi:uncharacterized membrane protein